MRQHASWMKTPRQRNFNVKLEKQSYEIFM